MYPGVFLHEPKELAGLFDGKMQIINIDNNFLSNLIVFDWNSIL